MAKSKKQKKDLIDKYIDSINQSKGMVIVKTQKLSPNEVTGFKKAINEFDSKFNVVKNTLFKIALEKSELENVDSLETGSHSVMFMGEDIISPAKKLKDFIDETKIDKTNFKVTISAGFLDGDLLTSEQAKELSEMPNKEESISMILGILDQAVSGVANVLEDAPRSFVTILDQAFEDKE